MQQNHQLKNFSRKTFLKFAAWPITIMGAIAVTGGFHLLYSGKEKNIYSRFLSFFESDNKYVLKGRFILNLKSKVINYISLEKYNRTSHKNSSNLVLTYWERDLEKGHLNFQKSGIIFENLALSELTNEINDTTLLNSIKVLSEVFQTPYVNYNFKNWRLYDLLALLIILNNSFSKAEKWEEFNRITSLVPFEKVLIPDRKKWIKTEKGFIQNKLNIIKGDIQQCENKLNLRIKKNWVGLG